MYDVYVGSYQTAGEAALHHWVWRPESMVLEPKEGVKGIANPSFLVLDAAEGRLYAVSETAPKGAVWSFALDADGHPLALNERATTGASPCHLALIPSHRGITVTNYGGGTVDWFALEPDGSVGELVAQVRHDGRGPHQGRQEGPHPHSSWPLADGETLVVADLGIDRLVRYRLDTSEGRLRPVGFTASRPGSGPRYVALHPTRPRAYVLHELDSTVGVYGWGAGDEWTELHVHSLLPDDFAGENTAAHLEITPDGRYLYASNRGHDSLVAFRLDDDGTELTLLGWVSTRGQMPRHFAITADGRWLFAANQKSGDLRVFARGPGGALSPTGVAATVKSPTAVAVVSRAKQSNAEAP